MAQEYALGEWIRREYGWLVDNKYHSSKVLVRSSYADRCIMSAQALLAGLFRPAVGDFFIADLAWRPVPVHATPRHLDKVQKLIIFRIILLQLIMMIVDRYRSAL